MAFGEKKSFFGRLKEGLTKTKDNMVGKIEDVIFQRPEIDEDMMEELEETLILSDIGMETTGKIIDRLRRDIKAEKLDTPEKVMKQIKKIIYPYLIEQKWNSIRHKRQAIKQSLAEGTPTTSEKVLKLGQDITSLGRQAFRLQSEYESFRA